MVNNKLSFASLAMLMAWGSLHAAEPAGKVLALQGAAVVVRGTQEIPLGRGVAVESGDLLRVADGSSLQVRFTDESVVALRAGTQFKIDDYKFSEKGEGDTTLFSLLKGGMRTITGLIGKRNPAAYQMRSTTATIGIRGTHFTAVNCAADCTNGDGSKADDGLYGAVTDGRIVVSNQSGESEFGRDQYFMVASQNTPASRLLAPPAFLRDKLDGMARSKGKIDGRTAETAAAGSDTASSATSSGSTSTSETVSPVPTAIAASATTVTPSITYVAADAPVVQTSTTTGAMLLNFAGVFADTGTSSYTDASGFTSSGSFSGGYAETVALNITALSSTAGCAAAGSLLGCAATDFADIKEAGFTSVADFYNNAFSETFSFTVPSSGVTHTGTYTKTASIEAGSDLNAGNVAWGRFSESEVETGSDGSSFSWSSFTHWAVGDPVTAPPTSGIFTYNPIGGTSPTDASGAVGAMSNRGQWMINFGASTLHTSQAISWSMPGGTTYSVTVPSQAFIVSTTSDPTFGTVSVIANASGSPLTSATSCGGSCISATSQVSVVGFGAQAQGLGASVATTGSISAGAQQEMASVQVYKR